MADALLSVTVASAQSVAKVFVIGGLGWAAVKFPRKAPFLPSMLVGTIARFTFHAFTIPLIYSTIAIAVTVQSVGDYWSLIVGGWIVLGISYGIATLLHRTILPIANRRDFVALRVAVTYPNIVALPILIFPSLCEYPVVYEGYAAGYDPTSSGTNNIDLRGECVAQSTTMIFCSFFAWSLAFWSFGNPQLMNAATAMSSTDGTGGMARHHHPHADDARTAATAQGIDQDDNPSVASTNTNIDDNDDNDIGGGNNNQSGTISSEERGILPSGLADESDIELSTPQSNTIENEEPLTDIQASSGQQSPIPSSSEDDQRSLSRSGIRGTADDEPPPARNHFRSSIRPILVRMGTSIRQTTTSPGFVAMMLGFLTGCIPPLQDALFEPGGALRFFGSAMETLGTASAPISTMVVAASLVPPRPLQAHAGDEHIHEEDDDDDNHHNDVDHSQPIVDERPGMTDPNFGPYRRRRRQRQQGSNGRWDRRTSLSSSTQFVAQLGRSMRSSSMRILQAVPRSTPEMRKIHLWFNLSRLIITPAIVVGMILALDCTGSGRSLASIPNLAKLVIIVNSALPGALIIVVLLKSKEEMADTAAAVSKVYLPNYLLSIFTLAAWTTVGLWITLPDADGNTLCQR